MLGCQLLRRHVWLHWAWLIDLWLFAAHLCPVQALLGGGFSLDQIRSATLTNLTIDSNTASFAGGAAVMLQAGQVFWSDSVISSNRASMGGGLAVDSSSLALERVVVSNNTAGAGINAAALDQVHLVRLYYPRVSSDH